MPKGAEALQRPNVLKPEPSPQDRGEDLAELEVMQGPQEIGEVVGEEADDLELEEVDELEKESKEDRERRWARDLNLRRIGEPKERNGVSLGKERFYIKLNKEGEPAILGEGAFGAVAEAQIPVEYWGDQLHYKKLNPEQMADTLKDEAGEYEGDLQVYAENPSNENLKSLELSQENLLAVFSAAGRFNAEQQKEFETTAIHSGVNKELVDEAFKNVRRFRGKGEAIATEVNKWEQRMDEFSRGQKKAEIVKSVTALKAAGALLPEKEKKIFYETMQPGATTTVIKYTEEISRDSKNGLRDTLEVMTFRELNILKKLGVQKDENGKIIAPALENFPQLEGAYEMRTSPTPMPTMDWINNASSESERKKRMAIRKEALEKRQFDAVRIALRETRMPGENLLEILKKRRSFSAEETLKIMEKVAKDMGDLHKRGIVNRDVKLNNLMYEEETGRVGNIDLGIAIDLNEQTKAYDTVKRKMLAKSREVVNDIMQSLSADVKNKDLGEDYLQDKIFSLFTKRQGEVEYQGFEKVLSKAEQDRLDALINRELKEYISDEIGIARLEKISPEGEKRLSQVDDQIDRLFEQKFSGIEIIDFFKVDYEIDPELQTLPEVEKKAEMWRITQKVKEKMSPDQRKKLRSVWKGMYTLAGMTRGTPVFMAPEQITGEPTSKQMDIYPIGVMIEGLFKGINFLEIDRREKAYFPIEILAPMVAKGEAIDREIDVENIKDPEEKIMRKLARQIAVIDPKERPQSMEEVVKLIKNARAELKNVKRAA